MLFGDSYEPVAWEQARRQKAVSKELIKAARNFPDKVRFYTLWLQMQRINKDLIEGDIAELGVYKGETARLLHLMAPERSLHLFDTFGGFTSTDLQAESGEAATYTTKNFADTSISKVLNKVGGDTGKISIHAGYFPQSASECGELRYALVSIDVDLYIPTKAGLEYFYPRLSAGGVILIHDYNHKWEGLLRAVDEFLVNSNEYLIPVADMEGTVMIIKHQHDNP